MPERERERERESSKRIHSTGSSLKFVRHGLSDPFLNHFIMVSTRYESVPKFSSPTVQRSKDHSLHIRINKFRLQ